jgi:glucose/arabinose dehydrogenase
VGATRAEPGKRRACFRDVIQVPDGAALLLSEGENGELLRLTPATETMGAR